MKDTSPFFAMMTFCSFAFFVIGAPIAALCYIDAHAALVHAVAFQSGFSMEQVWRVDLYRYSAIILATFSLATSFALPLAITKMKYFIILASVVEMIMVSFIVLFVF